MNLLWIIPWDFLQPSPNLAPTEWIMAARWRAYQKLIAQRALPAPNLP